MYLGLTRRAGGGGLYVGLTHVVNPSPSNSLAVATQDGQERVNPIYMHMYISISISISMYIYTYVCMHVCTYVCMYVCIYLSMCIYRCECSRISSLCVCACVLFVNYTSVNALESSYLLTPSSSNTLAVATQDDQERAGPGPLWALQVCGLSL